MEAIVNLYRVTHFGEPVHARPELNETEPPHADMLRYDLAFANPENVSQVVFPIFGSKNGRTTENITVPRWQSHCMKLVLEATEFITGLDKWITYRHVENDWTLTRKTLGEIIEERRIEGLKVVSWR